MTPELDDALHKIIDRATTGGPPPDFSVMITGAPNRAIRRHRPAVALVATVIAIVAVPAAVAVTRTKDDRKRVVTTSQQGMWLRSTPAPVSARTNSATAWTGDQLLVWGGFDLAGMPKNDGARYDPAADRWTTLPPAPLAPRGDVASAWTGRELIIWGGEGTAREIYSDGAAFDPTTNKWRRLSSAPLTARAGAQGIWLNTTVLITGGRTSSAEASDDVAVYTPANDSWSMADPTPIKEADHQAVRVRSTVVLLPGEQSPCKIVAAGDVVEWADITPPDAPTTCRARGAWTGNKLVVRLVRDSHNSSSARWLSWRPDTRQWRPIPNPVDPPHDTAAVAAVSRTVVVAGTACGLDGTNKPDFALTPQRSWLHLTSASDNARPRCNASALVDVQHRRILYWQGGVANGSVPDRTVRIFALAADHGG